MKKLFVPYELAKILKEKGFNEPCFGRHNPNATFEHDKFHFISHYKNSDSEFISAPIYQQVIDWLREEHLIHVQILCESFMDLFAGKIENADGFIETEDTNDYYEALNKAIEEALKLI